MSSSSGVSTACPCCSGGTYADCCEPLHAGAIEAPTALALMRARYSAFALEDVRYLNRTWHPATRPSPLVPDVDVQWTRLEILAVRDGGPDDERGTVEFRAHHRTAGRDGSMHERSTFTRRGGRWVYLDGVVPKG